MNDVKDVYIILNIHSNKIKYIIIKQFIYYMNLSDSFVDSKLLLISPIYNQSV